MNGKSWVVAGSITAMLGAGYMLNHEAEPSEAVFSQTINEEFTLHVDTETALGGLAVFCGLGAIGYSGYGRGYNEGRDFINRENLYNSSSKNIST